MRNTTKDIVVVICLIGAHVLAGIYDGDLLKVLLGADIMIAAKLSGVDPLG